jgi:hypothetical protein
MFSNIFLKLLNHLRFHQHFLSPPLLFSITSARDEGIVNLKRRIEEDDSNSSPIISVVVTTAPCFEKASSSPLLSRRFLFGGAVLSLRPEFDEPGAAMRTRKVGLLEFWFAKETVFFFCLLLEFFLCTSSLSHFF